jgi:hypothetical protein
VLLLPRTVHPVAVLIHFVAPCLATAAARRIAVWRTVLLGTVRTFVYLPWSVDA